MLCHRQKVKTLKQLFILILLHEFCLNDILQGIIIKLPLPHFESKFMANTTNRYFFEKSKNNISS